MRDVIVDVTDDVEIPDDESGIKSCPDVGEDCYIDISEVQVSRSYGDFRSGNGVTRVRYNHMPYARYRMPAGHVSFRYSRFDRYEKPVHRENPTMAMFRDYQQQIDEIAASSKSFREQRDSCVKLVNRFKQQLRTSNIRYRNLWRNLDCHGIVTIK